MLGESGLRPWAETQKPAYFPERTGNRYDENISAYRRARLLERKALPGGLFRHAKKPFPGEMFLSFLQ
jgi:hypothetical protein